MRIIDLFFIIFIKISSLYYILSFLFLFKYYIGYENQGAPLMELYKNSLMKPDTHFYYFGYSTDINCYLIVTNIAINVLRK